MQYRLSTIFLVFFAVATSLAVFGTWGLLVSAIACGIALLHYWKNLGTVALELGCIISIIVVLMGLLLPSLSHPHYGPRCNSNLKQIGRGLHFYHDTHKQFPPLIVNDKDGKPLYSWMVPILPHMEYDTIYDRLDKNEPWNSRHNARAIGQLQMDEFLCPLSPKNAKNFTTNYLAIVGPGTIWRKEGPVSLKDLPNSSSLTVMAVECAESDKHWAEPYSLTVEEALERMKTGKGTRISTLHEGRVYVLFADGGVRNLSTDMPISVWRKLLMGEIKSLDELDNWKPSPADPAPVKMWINQPPPQPGKWPFLLSILVWLVSLVLLFHRAWKSRKLSETQETTGG